jgi:hypothetical protein
VAVVVGRCGARSAVAATTRSTIWFGSQGLNHTGHAMRMGDEWKVSRDTWCGLVRMIGVECPPPPD